MYLPCTAAVVSVLPSETVKPGVPAYVTQHKSKQCMRGQNQGAWEFVKHLECKYVVYCN